MTEIGFDGTAVSNSVSPIDPAEKSGREYIRWRLKQFIGRSGLMTSHHSLNDTIGQRGRFLQIVCHHDGGDTQFPQG